jgi:hypothetical protein
MPLSKLVSLSPPPPHTHTHHPTPPLSLALALALGQLLSFVKCLFVRTSMHVCVRTCMHSPTSLLVPVFFMKENRRVGSVKLIKCAGTQNTKVGYPREGTRQTRPSAASRNDVWVRSPRPPTDYIKKNSIFCQSSSWRLWPICGTATLTVLSCYRAKPIPKTVTPPK